MNEATSLSLDDLITRYDRELRWVIYRRIGRLDVVADLLQETYWRVLTHGLTQTAQHPRALLHRIAANLATDYQRAQKVRSQYQAAEIETASSVCPLPLPDRVVESAERFEILQRAVERLPPRCREVFVLRNFEELSQAEIAARLGISPEMVGRHLSRALKLCRAALDRADE